MDSPFGGLRLGLIASLLLALGACGRTPLSLDPDGGQVVPPTDSGPTDGRVPVDGSKPCRDDVHCDDGAVCMK